MNKIGFMQGRLSPIVNNKIQAFPVETWDSEFSIANKIGIKFMEWTLDHDKIIDNPLMNSEGRVKIRKLSKTNNIKINSLTGDCFMQEPFWKKSNFDSSYLKDIFKNVCLACNDIGIELVVIPIVDNGSISNLKERNSLINFLMENLTFFEKLSLKILFESDLKPLELKEFINIFPESVFGINYDTGNSASLGFNPKEEFDCYGERILNVHIKDRKYKGSSVPLGLGAVNFKLIFSLLRQHNYQGNLILQTARSKDNNHAKELINSIEKINCFREVNL